MQGEGLRKLTPKGATCTEAPGTGERSGTVGRKEIMWSVGEPQQRETSRTDFAPSCREFAPSSNEGKHGPKHGQESEGARSRRHYHIRHLGSGSEQHRQQPRGTLPTILSAVTGSPGPMTSKGPGVRASSHAALRGPALARTREVLPPEGKARQTAQHPFPPPQPPATAHCLIPSFCRPRAKQSHLHRARQWPLDDLEWPERVLHPWLTLE
jgi:hypothetical protein